MRITLFIILSIIISLSVVSCAREKTSDSEFREYVRNGKISDIELSLKNGYDVNTLGYAKENALHEANSIEVVKLLINAGIDINNRALPKIDGRTALHLACIAGNVELKIVKLLVDSGADIDIKDAKGKTAYDYALEYKFSEKAAFLKDYKNIKTR